MIWFCFVVWVCLFGVRVYDLLGGGRGLLKWDVWFRVVLKLGGDLFVVCVD